MKLSEIEEWIIQIIEDEGEAITTEIRDEIGTVSQYVINGYISHLRLLGLVEGRRKDAMTFLRLTGKGLDVCRGIYARGNGTKGQKSRYEEVGSIC